MRLFHHARQYTGAGLRAECIALAHFSTTEATFGLTAFLILFPSFRRWDRGYRIGIKNQ